MATAVTEAHATLRRARGEAAKLRSEMVPAATSSYAAVSEGYGLGKFGLNDVLDARRILTAIRLQLLRSIAEVHHAAAEIERLTSVGAGMATKESDENAN